MAPKKNLRAVNRHIDFDREGAKGNARKRDTEVRCVECGILFVLPFKPRKPEVYCDACFAKRKR